MAVTCSDFKNLGDFSDYISQIRKETQFNATLLKQCQAEICTTLYGIGNPDVSGIGVRIPPFVVMLFSLVMLIQSIQMCAGYIAELCLGCLFGYAYFIFSRDTGNHEPAASWKRAVERGLTAFFDSAVYFAIAVQLASTVVLVKKDYGLSTDGFGAIQAQISWAVSLVCVLPLLYPMALLGWDKVARRYRHEKQDRKEQEESYRVRRLLFYLALVLFCYPFLSQCMHNWAPSVIGEGNAPGGATWITDAEQAKLEDLCFGQVNPLSGTESIVVAGFELAASLVVFIYAVLDLRKQLGRVGGDVLLKSAGNTNDRPASAVASLDSYLESPDEPTFDSATIVWMVVLLGPLLLSIPLLWAIFRMRGIQRELAKVTGSTYVDNDWSFGQVVSIVMFAPVVVEFARAGLHEVET